MPSRNSLKSFLGDATYHVYNRGVGKANIFKDTQDYRAFLRRLELMLLPKDKLDNVQHARNRIRINNHHDTVRLLAFCLMPNHFHLMIWQDNSTAVTEMMRTLCTSYSMYFNRKYDRVGPLFQGRFKAAHVDTDAYMMHLSRYIHCNPLSLNEDLYAYPYSSLQYYFGGHCPAWLSPKQIENYFESREDYKNFVDDLKSIASAHENYCLDM